MNNHFSKEIEVKARELNFDIVGFSSSEFLDKSIKKNYKDLFQREDTVIWNG